MQRLNFHRMKVAMRNAEQEMSEPVRYEADMKTVVPRIGVWPNRDVIPQNVADEVERQRKIQSGEVVEDFSKEKQIANVSQTDAIDFFQFRVVFLFLSRFFCFFFLSIFPFLLFLWDFGVGKIIDYRWDNRQFWLSAHNCQFPTPTSQNQEREQPIRIFGAD
jgi:hypothetical protein